MEDYRIADKDNRIYSMGLTRVDGGIHVCAAADAEECGLVLFKEGEDESFCRLAFPLKERRGDVWSMTVLGDDFSGVEYCFEKDGKLFPDPYGRAFTGREIWGDVGNADRLMRTPVELPEFDWEGDAPLERPYEDTVIYRLHVRGLTKHASSRCRQRGTYAGVVEKIPYFKELGITALEFLPVNEFLEVMKSPITCDQQGIMHPERVESDPNQDEKPMEKINYWGYTPGYYFAPKASYSSGQKKDPAGEFKQMVKTLHQAGIEVIIELYFTGEEHPAFVLDAVRFWVEEYHVDGIHTVGSVPLDLIGRDPYLSRTKLFAVSWNGVDAGHERHLAEYHEGFLVDMRRVLKGDEDQMNSLIFRSKYNPDAYGAINYMANTNGFTMMDMVSYDSKHNEPNGENNQDGTVWNYSWNCGVEGITRKKKIIELRKKQIRNSLILLFLSQGTPLLLAGDEFGRSKSGNNNSYCQDNEISWLNWNLLRTNKDIFDFTKALIAFRKAHPVFHQKNELKVMDYLSCGRPDVSYHGVDAWYPQFENFRRQLGILYWGEYGRKADGTKDHTIFIAYNMHWEPHEFALPNLPKDQEWFVAFDTDKQEAEGFCPEGEEPAVGDRQIEVHARSIVVFMGKEVKGKKKRENAKRSVE